MKPSMPWEFPRWPSTQTLNQVIGSGAVVNPACKWVVSL